MAIKTANIYFGTLILSKIQRQSHEYHALMSCASGLQKLGYKINCTLDNMDFNCDVGVTFGWSKNPNHHRIQIIKKLERDNKIAISLDGGLFATYQRKVCDPNVNEGWMTYRLSRGMPTGRGNFANNNCPSDRWLHQKKVLDIDYKPWRTNGENILFYTQYEKCWNYDNPIDYMQWVYNTIDNILDITDRNIIVRRHPTLHQNNEQLKRNFAKYIKRFDDKRVVMDNEVSRTNLMDCLDNTWVTVTHSSSAPVDSIISGVPSIAFGKNCMAYNISEHSLDNINDPVLPDRDQWVHNLAYTSWTPEEIKAGVPFERLIC